MVFTATMKFFAYFKSKVLCILETRSRPKKAKQYVYTKECKPVARQVVDYPPCKYCLQSPPHPPPPSPKNFLFFYDITTCPSGFRLVFPEVVDVICYFLVRCVRAKNIKSYEPPATRSRRRCAATSPRRSARRRRRSTATRSRRWSGRRFASPTRRILLTAPSITSKFLAMFWCFNF